jgi:hypothetical protein
MHTVSLGRIPKAHIKRACALAMVFQSFRPIAKMLLHVPLYRLC